MGPTWVLSAPDGPHVGPMNLAIRLVADALTHTLSLGKMAAILQTVYFVYQEMFISWLKFHFLQRLVSWTNTFRVWITSFSLSSDVVWLLIHIVLKLPLNIDENYNPQMKAEPPLLGKGVLWMHLKNTLKCSMRLITRKGCCIKENFLHWDFLKLRWY